MGSLSNSACNYVKFETGWNLLPILKIIAHTAHALLLPPIKSKVLGHATDRPRCIKWWHLTAFPLHTTYMHVVRRLCSYVGTVAAVSRIWPLHFLGGKLIFITCS